MANIKLTTGNRYTFAALDGTPTLIDSTDGAGETTTFNNHVQIKDINGDGNGVLMIMCVNTDVSNGPHLHLYQGSSGNTGIHYDQATGGTYNTDWTTGIDSSEGTEFRWNNSTALAGTPEMKLSSTGFLTVTGGITVGNTLDMNDQLIDHVREIQFQDWDDSSETPHDTSRLLMRDSTLMVYNGGLCVGNYSDNSLGDIKDTQLDVEELISIGYGNNGTTSAVAKSGNEDILDIYMCDEDEATASNDQNTAWMNWRSDQSRFMMGLNVNANYSLGPVFRGLFYDGNNYEGFNVDADGDMHINGNYSNSDERLKENVQTVPNALDLVKQMRGVTFDWKNKKNSSKKASAGVIAQEIEAIEGIPEGIIFTDTSVVTYDEDGKKSEGSPTIDNKKQANYSTFTAYFIEAIKEQQTIIEDLKARIETLENA